MIQGCSVDVGMSTVIAHVLQICAQAAAHPVQSLLPEQRDTSDACRHNICQASLACLQMLCKALPAIAERFLSSIATPALSMLMTGRCLDIIASP